MNEGARLEELFELHHSMLWRFALRMINSPVEAEDLVQETFLRALAHRGALPSGEVSARAWLTQTLVNLCRDAYRRRTVRERHEAGTRGRGAGIGASDPEGLVAAHQAFRRGIEGLSTRRRAVLVLHHLEGLDVDQVGELLGLKQPTVRWHLAAAQRHLRRALARRDEKLR